MTVATGAAPGRPVRRRPRWSLLGDRGAYWVLFVGTQVFIAVTAGGFGIIAAVALGLLALARAVPMLCRDRAIPNRVVVVLCAGVLLATSLGAAQLPATEAVTGYSAWMFGMATFVLLALTVAGRFVAAWITMAGVAGVAIGWSLATGIGVGVGIELVDRHVGTLVVGTLLATSLRRSVAASEAFRAVEGRRRADERAAHARTDARRDAAAAVLAQVGPTLRAIAAGTPLSDDDRRELLALEGALRDQIRTPALSRGTLGAAAADARRRGVSVLLLDEAEGADDAARAAAAGWLAEALTGTEGGSFTGRLRAVGGELKVSAVTERGAATAAIPVVRNGAPTEP